LRIQTTSENYVVNLDCCCRNASRGLSETAELMPAPSRVQGAGAGVNSRLCWMSTWRRTSTLQWNVFRHVWQANGLNPVCLRLWVMRFDDWLKALPHWRHTYGFSPDKANRSAQWFNCFSRGGGSPDFRF